jgi:hypothetical protein
MNMTRWRYLKQVQLKAHFGILVFLALLLLSGPGSGQSREQGSAAAKAGFRNEAEIAVKFGDWRRDEDARAWLAAMGYEPDGIVAVEARRPHGEKADVQVRVRTKDAERIEGISVKLVSGTRGFNQVDKRWLSHYAKLWKMPAVVIEGLKLFTGETRPRVESRNTERMFLDELDTEQRDAIVAFFSEHKAKIVSDLLEGDGAFAAEWLLVAYRPAGKTRWVLKSSADAARFFGDGPVTITRAGNLKIGRITMQRKGGDGRRETAKMLQFKIDPALLLNEK